MNKSTTIAIMKESVTIAKQILNESSDETNPATIKRIDLAIKRWIVKEYNIPIGALRQFSKLKDRGDVWISDGLYLDLTNDTKKTPLNRLFKKIGLSVAIVFSPEYQVGGSGAVTFEYSYQHYSGQNGHADAVRFTYDVDSRGNVNIKPTNR